METSDRYNYAGEKTPGRYAVLHPRTRRPLHATGGAHEWTAGDGFDLDGALLFDAPAEAEGYLRRHGLAGEIHRLPIPTREVPRVGLVGTRHHAYEATAYDFVASLVGVAAEGPAD